MITLITGTPGAGKTLYAVSELLGGEYAGRPLYVDGIPDLLLDHEVTEESATWHEWIPEGKDAVLVVDECQRVWRPRSFGKNVPEGVAAMETHRHMGVDIVLITQHPNLLDANIRRLVGRHIHVRRLWGFNRTMVYEWDGATDPQRTSTAVSRSWTYPKKAFTWYKSATAHTARKQRVPIALYLLVGAIIGVPLVAFMGYQAFFSRFTDDETVIPLAQEEPAMRGALAAALPRSSEPETSEIEFTPDDFLPSDPRYPEMAPAYRELLEVKTYPKVAACVVYEEKFGCNCWTQQGTPIFIPNDDCRQRVAQGNPFDPYRDESQPPENTYGPALDRAETSEIPLPPLPVNRRIKVPDAPEYRYLTDAG